jgi:hypothetical protein
MARAWVSGTKADRRWEAKSWTKKERASLRNVMVTNQQLYMLAFKQNPILVRGEEHLGKVFAQFLETWGVVC